MELTKKSKLATSINNDLKYVTISKVVGRSFEEIFQKLYEYCLERYRASLEKGFN